MSKCLFCKNVASESCSFAEIKVNGNWHKRNFISFGGETIKKICQQCGIVIGPGHYHHYGCKNEACPECLRRIFDCECKKTHLRNEHGDEVEISK